MRGIVCLLIVTSCNGLGTATEPRSTATASGHQGGRQLKFDGGLGTQYEGILIALLGTCSVEGDATQEQWESALKGDYLRIQFPKAQTFAMNLQTKEVEVEEIVLPMSASALPKQIFVRNGKSYRSFAKHDPKLCIFIQDGLKSILAAR